MILTTTDVFVLRSSPAWHMLKQKEGRLICDVLPNGRWTLKVQGEKMTLRLVDVDFHSYSKALHVGRKIEELLAAPHSAPKSNGGLRRKPQK